MVAVTVIMTAMVVIRPFIVLFTRHPNPLPFIDPHTAKLCGFFQCVFFGR